MSINFNPKSAYLKSLRSNRVQSTSRSSIPADSPFGHGLDTMPIQSGCLQHLKGLDGKTTEDGLITIFDSGPIAPILYIRKGERQPLSDSAQEAAQETIENLKAALEKDADYNRPSSQEFFGHPVAKRLANALILSDQNLQDDIAKEIWNRWSCPDQLERLYANQGHSTMFPKSWQEIDVPAMLRSSHTATVNEVQAALDSVLLRRARTTGLTDAQRILSARYGRTEFFAHATFDDKVQPVMEQFEKAFQENGLELDKSKSYAFFLDTSDFTFTVTGGTEQENALMEEVINTKNIWGHSYDTDNMNTVINALLYHRREDGSYNSWSSIGGLSAEEKAEEIRKHGIADAPKEYETKMQQLDSAYHWYRLDQSMKRYYGFGVNDLAYKNGRITGKTDEVNAIIEKDIINFMKTKGCAYIELTKHYSGTPAFESPVFTLNGGKFQATYAAV